MNGTLSISILVAVAIHAGLLLSYRDAGFGSRTKGEETGIRAQFVELPGEEPPTIKERPGNAEAELESLSSSGTWEVHWPEFNADCDITPENVKSLLQKDNERTLEIRDFGTETLPLTGKPTDGK